MALVVETHHWLWSRFVDLQVLKTKIQLVKLEKKTLANGVSTNPVL